MRYKVQKDTAEDIRNFRKKSVLIFCLCFFIVSLMGAFWMMVHADPNTSAAHYTDRSIRTVVQASPHKNTGSEDYKTYMRSAVYDQLMALYYKPYEPMGWVRAAHLQSMTIDNDQEGRIYQALDIAQALKPNLKGEIEKQRAFLLRDMKGSQP